MLLIKLEILLRKRGSWLYQTKKGRHWCQDAINLVKVFYENNEFPGQMLGKRDYVSVFHNTHKQKQFFQI